MSVILQLTDFDTGWFTTPLAAKQEAVLQEVIDDVEEEYLPLLFGVELHALFLADLDPNGVPQTARFQFIYNKFVLQDDYCIYDTIYQSKGMKKMLQGIVYFLYQRDQFTRATDNGAKMTRSENSDRARKVEHDIFSRWNQSHKYWTAIQWVMHDEREDEYPEFLGKPLEPVNRF